MAGYYGSVEWQEGVVFIAACGPNLECSMARVTTAWDFWPLGSHASPLPSPGAAAPRNNNTYTHTNTNTLNPFKIH